MGVCNPLIDAGCGGAALQPSVYGGFRGAARQPTVVGGFRGGIRNPLIDAGLRPTICAGIDVGAGIGAIKTKQTQRKQKAKPDDKSAGGFRLWAGLVVCARQRLSLCISKFDC